jgi:hypothetical protein
LKPEPRRQSARFRRHHAQGCHLSRPPWCLGEQAVGHRINAVRQACWPTLKPRWAPIPAPPGPCWRTHPVFQKCRRSTGADAGPQPVKVLGQAPALLRLNADKQSKRLGLSNLSGLATPDAPSRLPTRSRPRRASSTVCFAFVWDCLHEQT